MPTIRLQLEVLGLDREMIQAIRAIPGVVRVIQLAGYDRICRRPFPFRDHRFLKTENDPPPPSKTPPAAA